MVRGVFRVNRQGLGGLPWGGGRDTIGGGGGVGRRLRGTRAL